MTEPAYTFIRYGHCGNCGHLGNLTDHSCSTLVEERTDDEGGIWRTYEVTSPEGTWRVVWSPLEIVSRELMDQALTNSMKGL